MNDVRAEAMKNLHQKDKLTLENEIQKIYSKLSDVDATLADNRDDRVDLHKKSDDLAAKMEKQFQSSDKKLTERLSKILERLNFTEREINQSLQILSKEIERIKYDLNDHMDTKFEHIMHNLDKETKTLRETYEELSTNLRLTSQTISQSFKDKMLTIKSMVATYFAKIDSQMSKNMEKVEKIDKGFSQFESNFVNPSKEVEAKIFSMNMRVDQSDRMRESQYQVIKDTIKKLILALEAQSVSQTQSLSLKNLIAQQQSNLGQISHMSLGGNSNYSPLPEHDQIFR